MEDSLLFNKVETIERCLSRVKEVYADNFENLKDYTKQDSIILNIERACQATIDIAMMIVSERKLGIPQNSRDAFEVLYSNNIINSSLLKKLKSMVGFRNIAVHNYRSLNIEIIKQVVEKHLQDFIEFISVVTKLQY